MRIFFFCCSQINFSLLSFLYSSSFSSPLAFLLPFSSFRPRTLGLYKCEVSLEGPSFSSVQGESYMLVVCKYKKRETFLFIQIIFNENSSRSSKQWPIYYGRRAVISIGRKAKFELQFGTKSSGIKTPIFYQQRPGM
jgi:hypothetical protein